MTMSVSLHKTGRLSRFQAWHSRIRRRHRGKNLRPFGEPKPNSELRDATAFGVLKLTLKPNSYEWQFIPQAGKSFTDSGSGNCHGRP